MSPDISVSAARIRELLRANLAALLAGVLLLLLVAAAVRWIAGQRGEPPPRKVMQFTMVQVQPPREPPRQAPPPPPTQAPRQVDEAQSSRTEVRPIDIPPPDAPRPAADPGGGRLALAAEGEGPGDAFGLAGNPGGRSLLGGGGLGDGIGAGEGPGGAYGWYSGKIKLALEEALRRSRRLAGSSLSGEVRVQVDPTGRISLLQLLRPVGPEQEEELRSLVGLRIPEPPPPDMPTLIIRISARRPR